MQCPFCHGVEDKVVDSRLAEGGAAIRRRRECLVCSRRYTTFERAEEAVLVVVKRSGVREPFDRSKVVRGILRATKNRPIDDAAIEALAVAVEDQMRQLGPEVGTEAVGRAVLDGLRTLDPVSYLRFASVYKGFDDVTDFAREAGELQKTTSPKSGSGRPAT
ncbi:MAG: transcriptional regulator NrdR [Acidimicrobiia bacterium]